MAFHQPTRQATQRSYRPAINDDEVALRAPQPATQAVEESQTWVLFSPVSDVDTTTSYLTPTHHSKTTPGRSRLSDLGSVHTLARSEASGDQPPSPVVANENNADDDDGELDSLDSHLAEFRSNLHLAAESSQFFMHNAPVVPTHDGLGSFRLEQEGMGPDVQNRLYAFEQFNPRRVKRRRESVELGQVGTGIVPGQDMDKMQRIEMWRLDHSRCLLEEIQKQTRRHRQSTTSLLSASLASGKSDEAISHGVAGEANLDPADTWHDQQPSEMDAERESVWGRITRKVIRDLMGIDDRLLSVLFGETLPDEEDLSSTPRASTSSTPNAGVQTNSETDANWQLRALERIAQELGLFVHHISEHPGAFSTFTRMQQMHIPYAGLPAIPESANDNLRTSALREGESAIPEFKPTVTPQTKPLDVPGARSTHGTTPTFAQTQGETGPAGFTQEEWEQDLDVRLVFRYLRSRFLSRSSTSGSTSGSPHPATNNTHEAAAKAARVRQHHPLVSRTRPAERRNFKATTPSSPVLFRQSSCASQSTRRSVRRSSCSSRHYWDIGAGSVGTGSMIATAGPMGSWGEV